MSESGAAAPDDLDSVAGQILGKGYMPGRVLVRKQSRDQASVIVQICIGFCQ